MSPHFSLHLDKTFGFYEKKRRNWNSSSFTIVVTTCSLLGVVVITTKKRITSTHYREKVKEMIVASFISTWEWRLFPHERERDNCFFLCCYFHMGQRIVFHNDRKMDCFFFFFVSTCHMMRHRICYPIWEREMDYFHVNEKRNGPLLLFLVPPWERKRDGLFILLLLLPHEDEDCKFCMKDMIISFCFHMRPRICFPHKAWNTRS